MHPEIIHFVKSITAALDPDTMVFLFHNCIQYMIRILHCNNELYLSIEGYGDDTSVSDNLFNYQHAFTYCKINVYFT